MIYNLYKVSLDNKKNVTHLANYFDAILDDNLKALEEEIAGLYKLKQKDKKGIKTLGNEIRYSAKIKNIFLPREDFVLVKFTFNRTDFLLNFIKTIKQYRNKKIYIYIYSGLFKSESQLVDQTAITIDDVVRQLEILASVFVPKSQFENIFIAEVTSFSNYYFVKSEKKYSKIIENNG